jgi:hypothetical protein
MDEVENKGKQNLQCSGDLKRMNGKFEILCQGFFCGWNCE